MTPRSHQPAQEDRAPDRTMLNSMVKSDCQGHIGICQKDMSRSDREILYCGGVNDERLALKDGLVEGLFFAQFLIVGRSTLDEFA
jgi:hypothetical protein